VFLLNLLNFLQLTNDDDDDDDDELSQPTVSLPNFDSSHHCSL